MERNLLVDKNGKAPSVGDLRNLIQNSDKKELRVLKKVFDIHLDEQASKLRCPACSKMTRLDNHILLSKSTQRRDEDRYFCDMACLKKWINEQP